VGCYNAGDCWLLAARCCAENRLSESFCLFVYSLITCDLYLDHGESVVASVSSQKTSIVPSGAACGVRPEANWNPERHLEGQSGDSVERSRSERAYFDDPVRQPVRGNRAAGLQAWWVTAGAQREPPPNVYSRLRKLPRK